MLSGARWGGVSPTATSLAHGMAAKASSWEPVWSLSPALYLLSKPGALPNLGARTPPSSRAGGAASGTRTGGATEASRAGPGTQDAPHHATFVSVCEAGRLQGG